MDLIEGEFYPDVSSDTSDEQGRPTKRPSRSPIAAISTCSAELAATYFPGDAAVATMQDGDLVLLPLVSAAHGGLVLKQRNVAGDRSLLISEVLGFQQVGGTFDVAWDDARGALQVLLAPKKRDQADGDARGVPRCRPRWSRSAASGRSTS